MTKQLIIEAKNIRASRPDLEVAGIFNPAAISWKGETLLLARVAEKAKQTDPGFFLVPVFSETRTTDLLRLPKTDPAYDYSDPRIVKNGKNTYLTSLSHFQVFRSQDGRSFTPDEQGSVFPGNMYEEYGIEDPRITKIGKKYHITFAAVSPYGINVGLMVTEDFVHFSRLGNILHSDNKDCVIFPQKIKGKYVALHRPSISQFGKLDIWTAESDNLINWGNHKILKDARIAYTDSVRVGAGAVPVLTSKGWLVIYHSADAHDRYHLTAMLLDKNDPGKVLMKSRRPLIEPTEPFEKCGFTNEVVFTCGLVQHGDDLTIYYGVCDENIACCTLSMQEIWDNLEEVVQK